MDKLFRALASETRRQILRDLAETDDGILTDADFPGDKTQLAVLHHTHHPVLAEANLIEWSDDGGEHCIEQGEEFEVGIGVLRKAEELDASGTGRDMTW